MTLEEVTEQTSFRYLPWSHNTGRIYQIAGDANAYANILETRLAQADEEKARLLDELNRVKVEGTQIQQDLTGQLNDLRSTATERISELEAALESTNAARDVVVERTKNEAKSALASMRIERDRLVDAARVEMRRAGAKRAAELVAAVQAAVDRLYKDGN